MTPVPPGTTPPGGTAPPGSTPTPSPTPTPTPGSSGGSSGGGGYVTKPGTPRVTTKTMSGGSKVTYYIGQYTPGYGHQNLKDIKTYPTPTGDRKSTRLNSSH